MQVDISTMLEEAVHYVKFLQLQIKVLAKGNLSLYTYWKISNLYIYIFNNLIFCFLVGTL
jgi:hypothetical protein